MIRFCTLILALAVLAANAYCSCTWAAAASSVACGTADAQVGDDDGCCSGHNEDSRTDEHADHQANCGQKSHHDDGDQHTCAHCTGTLTADPSVAKTVVAPPVIVPHVVVPVISLVADPDHWATRDRPDFSGLPPPIGTPTLLNLACLLTI
jgi:hypothetical protein